ncbi:MAG: DUF1566 domain-containing protein [Leptospiraceae bacterium]|nr:DUF1566 domain-containing protein [Leptospiraceae bacterium]
MNFIYQFKKIIYVLLINNLVFVTLFASPFTDNGNGTITDVYSKLIWQKCSKGLSGNACKDGASSPEQWESAINYCNSLTLGGIVSGSWRLPNINELYSLVIVYSNMSIPHIDHAAFPNSNTSGPGYWSSTNYSGYAWSVMFNLYNMSYRPKTEKYYVRCVSGP